MVSTWMGDHSSVEVVAVVKIQYNLRSGETGPPIKTHEAKKHTQKHTKTPRQLELLSLSEVRK